ncbi:MAG: YbjQ family protein, partial [Acidobacteriaceae bacterium]|nr:YbjQ family protein [Acidobacteriaceae bacterium]
MHSDAKGPAQAINPEMVTTAFTLDGYQIDLNLGIVRGIIV